MFSFGAELLLRKGCTFVFSELLIRFVRDVLLLASGVKMITKLQVNELR